MDLRTAMLVFADSDVVDALRGAPVLDRLATLDLVRRLFPDHELEEVGGALLIDGVDPPDDVVYAGSFGTVDIVCSWHLVDGAPAARAGDLLAANERRNMYLHVLKCAEGDCAFALWRDGLLVRSLRLATGCEVEETGDRLPFEEPYWRAGARGGGPAGPHPADLGRRALYELFGFVLTGEDSLDDVDPEVIPLVGYRVAPARAEPGPAASAPAEVGRAEPAPAEVGRAEPAPAEVGRAEPAPAEAA